MSQNQNSYSKRLFSELRGRMAGMIDRVALKKFLTPRRWIVTQWWDREGDVDDNVEVFQGIGYVARPPDGTSAEAVLVNIGGFDHPCLVALRDGRTTTAVVDAVGLGVDEVIVHNSAVVMKLKADGTVEIRSLNGTAVPLATKADVDAVNARVDELQLIHNTHRHPSIPGSGGPVSGELPSQLSTAVAVVQGTSVLKGQ